MFDISVVSQNYQLFGDEALYVLHWRGMTRHTSGRMWVGGNRVPRKQARRVLNAVKRSAPGDLLPANVLEDFMNKMEVLKINQQVQ